MFNPFLRIRKMIHSIAEYMKERWAIIIWPIVAVWGVWGIVGYFCGYREAFDWVNSVLGLVAFPTIIISLLQHLKQDEEDVVLMFKSFKEHLINADDNGNAAPDHPPVGVFSFELMNNSDVDVYVKEIFCIDKNQYKYPIPTRVGALGYYPPKAIRPIDIVVKGTFEGNGMPAFPSSLTSFGFLHSLSEMEKYVVVTSRYENVEKTIPRSSTKKISDDLIRIVTFKTAREMMNDRLDVLIRQTSENAHL